jgi:hypothetical protein
VISSLYATAESPLTDPDDLERVQPLDFDRDECEDTIWHQIYNIQTTPALNHKCKDGIGRGRMLTVIRIDPKNVVTVSIDHKKFHKNINLALLVFLYFLIFESEYFFLMSIIFLQFSYNFPTKLIFFLLA